MYFPDVFLISLLFLTADPSTGVLVENGYFLSEAEMGWNLKF
jgi:hypothetical protein